MAIQPRDLSEEVLNAGAAYHSYCSNIFLLKNITKTHQLSIIRNGVFERR